MIRVDLEILFEKKMQLYLKNQFINEKLGVNKSHNIIVKLKL